jgi:hypothetical protein
MCGAKLPTTSNLFCEKCLRKRNADSVMRSYYRKKELKKTKGEKNILRLKAMLEGVDLTPYMPKPEDQAAEAQDE